MARALRTPGVGPVLTLAVVLVVALASCSWGPQEPGLFTSPDPSVSASAPSTPVGTPGPPNPRLPVVGEAHWTTADGSGVTVRLAVHALRHTAEATVLDWSVTPLAGPGRRPGEPVPAGTDLGLRRALAGEQNIALLDLRRHQAYRPLAAVSPELFRACLCTPLFATTPQLQFGVTRVLQLAFPRLPLGTFRVDVAFPNVAVIPGVPVTPVGGTPVAEVATDLARPSAPSRPATGVRTYTARDRDGRQQTLVVDQVVATPGLTSLLWTLHSVDDQDGTGASAGPPLSRPRSESVHLATEIPASGPRLRVKGRAARVGVLWTTATLAGQPAYECLCSALGLWSRGLRSGGGTAHLATHVGPLPRGTTRVDVLFPGVAPFTDVPVTRVEDEVGQVETVEPGTDATWTYDPSDPPRGWSPQDWPTPLPAAGQVRGYASRPEQILDDLPRS